MNETIFRIQRALYALGKCERTLSTNTPNNTVYDVFEALEQNGFTVSGTFLEEGDGHAQTTDNRFIKTRNNAILRFYGLFDGDIFLRINVDMNGSDILNLDMIHINGECHMELLLPLPVFCLHDMLEDEWYSSSEFKIQMDGPSKKLLITICRMFGFPTENLYWPGTSIDALAHEPSQLTMTLESDLLFY
jgi:hypothetical protein